jgi:hypothetical protein
MQDRADALERQRIAGALAIFMLVAVVCYLTVQFVIPALKIEPRSSLKLISPFELLAFPSWQARIPEPIEQQRYLVAVAFGLLLPVLIALAVSRERYLNRMRASVSAVIQTVVVGFVALAWVSDQQFIELYFPLAGATSGGLIAIVALCVALWAYRAKLATWSAQRGWGIEAFSLASATLATGLLCLAGLNRESDLATALPHAIYHYPFFFSETYSVAGGLTPLVDFIPSYSSLLPYLWAPFLSISPMSIGTYALVNTGTAVVALLLGYAALRLLVGKPIRALALYLPVLAISLLPVPDSGDILPVPNGGADGKVVTIATYFAVMPMRYAGPLACLAAVALAARKPSRVTLLIAGVVGGLTCINNFEFGVPAIFALGVAALAATYTRGEPRGDGARRAIMLLIGAAAALICFVLLTLLRSGELPNPSYYVFFSRQFAVAGVSMIPYGAVVAFSGIVFVTFIAATALGLAPALLGTRQMNSSGRIETAVLCFTGIFGMGAFAYYVGRSHPTVLTAVLCAWGFALAAVTFTSIRWITTSKGVSRSGSPLALMAIGLFAVTGAAAINQSGYGLKQPSRLLSKPSAAQANENIQFTRDCVRPGTNSMVFLPYGLRVAQAARLNDYFPFNSPDSVISKAQVGLMSDALDEQRVRAFIAGTLPLEIKTMLRSKGFVRRAQRTAASAGPGGILTVWGRSDDSAIRCAKNGFPPNTR